MSATAHDVSTEHYRLSRVEYDRAVERGAFKPEARLELVDGDLHAMTPEGSSICWANWICEAVSGVFLR